MPTPLANQTLARLQQARRTREAVSLPEVIKLIEELSARAFSISIQELADLISHDTMVTAKVIQSANTFGYNPFGQQVTTVSQAIHVVGFNKIRNLTLSMLLLENAAHGSHPEAQRESAALSLCSGLFAQTLAARRPGQDPEQAFVFACLRHYGRLLLTTFFPEEFKQVQQRPVTESEPDACRRIFGLSPLELTQHLFDESRLPRPILRCLQDLPANQLGGEATSPEEELAAITHFSAAMGELVISPRVGANGFADRAETLRATFGTKLQLPSDSIADLVGAVDQSLKVFARSYGTRVIATGVLQRISERVAQAEPLPVLPEGIVIGSTPAKAETGNRKSDTSAPETTRNAEGGTREDAAKARDGTPEADVSAKTLSPAEASALAEAVAKVAEPPTAPAPAESRATSPPTAPAAAGIFASGETGTPEPLTGYAERETRSAKPAVSAAAPAKADAPAAPPPPDGVTVLTECLLHLTELMTETELDLRAMEMAALRGIRMALQLRDCVLFIREATGGIFAAHSGLGDLAELVRGRPLINADRRDVFGISLTRREDVLIRDTSDPKLRPFLPEWLMGAGHVASFILLPLANERGAFALILGTRTNAPPLQPLARELQLMKALRQHLVSARRLAGLRG